MKTRATRWLVAAAVVAGCVVGWVLPAPGQEGASPDSPQRPFGRGRGGAMVAAMADLLSSPDGQWLRDLASSPLAHLADPDVRSEIGLSPEQDARLTALREKAQALFQKMRDDVQAAFAAQPDADAAAMTDEDLRALIQERMKTVAELLRQARPDLEGLANEARATLTPEQQARLKDAGELRTRLMLLGGGLWVLATRRAQEELGLGEDQVRQIRKILEEAAGKAEAVRQQSQAALEGVRQEERVPLLRARRETAQKDLQEIAEKAHDAVFTLLSTEQKVKAERLLESARSRRGFDAMRGRTIERRAPAPGETAPAAPAADGQ